LAEKQQNSQPAVKIKNEIFNEKCHDFVKILEVFKDKFFNF